MFPQPVKIDGGLKLLGTTSGSVPASAVLFEGMAMKADGTLYVVFL